MKNRKRIAAGGIVLAILLGSLTGCKAQEAGKRQISLKVKLPPLTVANADTGITDSYELLNNACEEFAAQYTDYDVTMEVVKFGYTEEDEYITGCLIRMMRRIFFLKAILTCRDIYIRAAWCRWTISSQRKCGQTLTVCFGR